MINFFDPGTWFHPEAWALFYRRDQAYMDKRIYSLIGSPERFRQSATEYNLLNAYGLLFGVQNGWVDIAEVDLPSDLFRTWTGVPTHEDEVDA